MELTEYEGWLFFPLVRYRVRFETDKGKVLTFMVQLETAEGSEWHPVVRYDTAHGYAHRDRYKADGTVISHERLQLQNYNDAFTFAANDVKANWRDWLRQYGVNVP